MICDRCGIANRSGRITCVQCLGPVMNGTGPGPAAMCAEHPDTPATGQCITCKKLVCDACGGVVNNRGVYCIDHTPVVTTGRASPGMNPLLAGGADAAAAVPVVAARKPSANMGLVGLIAGLLALVLLVVGLLVWPGPLASKPVPPPATTAGAGTGMDPSMGGFPSDPYGTGAAPGYPGAGYPGAGGPGFAPGPPDPGAAGGGMPMPGPGGGYPGPPSSER